MPMLRVFDYNNRILVDVGLKRIQQHLCRPGISALLEIAGREAITLKAQDLGFVLGPRINAAGRMGNAWISVLNVYWHRTLPLPIHWQNN